MLAPQPDGLIDLVRRQGQRLRYAALARLVRERTRVGGQLEALRDAYAAAGVEATLTAFIDDTASAFAQADLILCRSGASTVTEIAAVGAAALTYVAGFVAALGSYLQARAANGLWFLRIDDIDPSTIERVEVLRDGASAIYGTDAVGGMINFITKRDYQGLNVAVDSTRPTRTGGDSKRVTISGGKVTAAAAGSASVGGRSGEQR